MNGISEVIHYGNIVTLKIFLYAYIASYIV